MNRQQFNHQTKWAILPVILALLLGNACLTRPAPPPAPPTPPPNQTPIIHALTTEKEVATSSESEITCKATDADGDVLNYLWSADAGEIKGGGSSITWIAPDVPGNYTIKVTVTDSKGGEATKSTNITVVAKPNQPPVIIKLLKDGGPPDDENRAREWTTTTLQCIAEDPDGDKLSYMWRATGGKISGQGNTVGWTAPGVTGEYTVTIIVTDGRGGQAQESITFKVLCCGR